jgi:hypothetical protein
MNEHEVLEGVNLGFGTENPSYDTSVEHAFRIAQNVCGSIAKFHHLMTKQLRHREAHHAVLL